MNNNPNNLKKGDTIFVEQAWEDQTGSYHDGWAKITSIRKNGQIKLKFGMTKVTEFLRSAEFWAKDYKVDKKISDFLK